MLIERTRIMGNGKVKNFASKTGNVLIKRIDGDSSHLAHFPAFSLAILCRIRRAYARSSSFVIGDASQLETLTHQDFGTFSEKSNLTTVFAAFGSLQTKFSVMLDVAIVVSSFPVSSPSILPNAVPERKGQNFANSGSSMLRFAVRKLTPTSVTGRLSPLYWSA